MIIINTPSMALQKAQNTALRADPVLTQFVADRVYDDIPPNAVFPYIQIGDNQDIDDGNTCDVSPTEVYSRIHVWVRGPQRGIVSDQICHQIRKVLGTELVLEDYTATVGHFMMTDPVPTEDELEIHSVVTLRYLIQETYVP